MDENQNLVTVFITKYALTSGLMEEQMELKDGGLYCFGRPKGWYANTLFSKKDFFLSREEAIADCNKRKEKKILSLRRQMQKISAKTFS